MIEKSKVYPEFQYVPQKFQIDHFHNPYLAKLNIKLTPRPNTKSYRLLSPLSLNNNLYISQAIPLYKNEKFRLALLWREYLTNKYARAHFGLSMEYKIYQSFRLKTKGVVGSTSLLEFQISKSLQNEVEAFIGYSGMLQSNHLYSSFNFGLKRRSYSALLTKKLDSQTEIKLIASKQLYDGIYITAAYNGSIQSLQKGQFSINLNQNINNSSSASVGIVTNPYYQEIGLKAQYERSITKNEKLVLSTEYSNGASFFYFGFKNLNFNFIFPFFAIDGPVPVIVGTIAFGLGYYYRKKHSSKGGKYIELQNEGKIEEKRQEQLNIIGDKAADQYERQKLNRNGLLIEQAYVGPKDELEQFMRDPDRFIHLIRNEQYKQKFVDLTVTLRFYVIKGELKLRKGQKDSLLGFYRKKVSHNGIGIRYVKNDEQKVVFFDYLDPIIIQNQ